MRRPKQGDCFYCQPQKYGYFTVCPGKFDPEDVYNQLVATWAGFKCDKNKSRACLLADLNSQPSNNCLAFYYLTLRFHSGELSAGGIPSRGHCQKNQVSLLSSKF